MSEQVVREARSRRYWVWVFSDRRGLDWVVEHSTMAFAGSRRSYVSQHLSAGDEAVLYAAGKMGKGGMALCGHVGVTGQAEVGEGPPIQGGRFDVLIPIEAKLVLEESRWVPIRPLVSELDFLPDDKTWGWPLQQSPVETSIGDFRVMVSALRQARQR